MPDHETLQLIQTFIIVATAAGVLYRLGRAVEKFEQIGKRQADEISALKEGQKKMGEALVEIAVQQTRLDTQSERLNRIENHIDELRRGEGMILPLERGAYEVPPSRKIEKK